MHKTYCSSAHGLQVLESTTMYYYHTFNIWTNYKTNDNDLNGKSIYLKSTVSYTIVPGTEQYNINQLTMSKNIATTFPYLKKNRCTCYHRVIYRAIIMFVLNLLNLCCSYGKLLKVPLKACFSLCLKFKGTHWQKVQYWYGLKLDINSAQLRGWINVLTKSFSVPPHWFFGKCLLDKRM